MKAGFYNTGTGAVVRIMTASDTHLFNLNLAAGQTWREIPDAVQEFADAPALETLPAHADLVEP